MGRKVLKRLPADPLELQVEGARSLGSSAAAFAAGMQTFLSRARKKVEQLTARLSGAEDSFRYGAWLVVVVQGAGKRLACGIFTYIGDAGSLVL